MPLVKPCIAKMPEEYASKHQGKIFDVFLIFDCNFAKKNTVFPILPPPSDYASKLFQVHHSNGHQHTALLNG